MRFSIIIPGFNRAHLIMETLKSALNQSFSDYEVIFVDDGSTDNTREVVESLRDPRLHYHYKENAERGAARNYGIDKAKGEYLTFLDSDDILYSSFLERANESLKNFKEPVFFHQAYEFLDQNGKRRGLPQWHYDDDRKNLACGNPLSCLGVFVKRQFSERFRFNEDRNLATSEDWELWIRLFANFGLYRDDRVSAALIQHDLRSVLKADEEKLMKRMNLAIEYAFEDPKVEEIFNPLKNMIRAYWETYIALHLALDNKKRLAAKHFKLALNFRPSIIFSRRSMVILKLLIAGPV